MQKILLCSNLLCAMAFGGGLLSEKEIRKTVPKLVKPAEWVKTETLTRGEGVYDGSECVAALNYTMGGAKRLVAMSETPLARPGKMYGTAMNEFVSFPEGGLLGDFPDTPLKIFCEDAGYMLIQLEGTLSLPPFEKAAWYIANHGQDVADNGQVAIVLATKKGGNFAMQIPLYDLHDECKSKSGSEQFSCLQNLSKEGKAKFVAAIQAIAAKLEFAKRP